MTAIPFSPSASIPFQFQTTLGGNSYSITIPWNQYERRYYINIKTVQGVLVYAMPLIGSPPEYNISLLPQLDPATGKPWTSKLYFIQATQTFMVLP